MNKIEYKSFMKKFFEEYYAKLLENGVEAVTLPEVPEDMQVKGTDPEEEWQQWKLIPATMFKTFYSIIMYRNIKMFFEYIFSSL